jgi:ATP-dependent DNA helicase RecQ
VEKPPHFVESAPTSSIVETFHRPRATAPEPDTLTPDQQALDQRLREWRKAESERLNLPLFFVLASTTLRSIVLARPQTLSQLKTIQGLGHEKIEKFGDGILEICTT